MLNPIYFFVQNEDDDDEDEDGKFCAAIIDRYQRFFRHFAHKGFVCSFSLNVLHYLLSTCSYQQTFYATHRR